MARRGGALHVGPGCSASDSKLDGFRAQEAGFVLVVGEGCNEGGQELLSSIPSGGSVNN